MAPSAASAACLTGVPDPSVTSANPRSEHAQRNWPAAAFQEHQALGAFRELVVHQLRQRSPCLATPHRPRQVGVLVAAACQQTGETQLTASQFRVERIVQSGDGKIKRLTPPVYHFSRV